MSNFAIRAKYHGGIIVKDVMRRAAYEQDGALSNIFTSTKAVFFLGTPHRGSNAAAIGEMLRKLASASGFDTSDRNIRALHINSSELEIVHEEFMKLYLRSPRPFEICTFQEAQGQLGVSYLGLSQKVVDDVSSSFTGTERCQAINKNHMSMCRFSTRDDSGYRKVAGDLKVFLSAMEEDGSKDAGAAANESLSPTVSSVYSFTGIERFCMRLFNSADVGEYKSILPRREEGTCQWILSNPQYLYWYCEEKSCLLWISGHPGTGKTILSAYLLDHLSLNTLPIFSRNSVGFFFCDDKVESQRDGRAILRSLIHQILTRRRKLIKHIKDAYDVQGPDLVNNFNELWRIFKSIITDKEAGSICIIIDAIDECEKSTGIRLLEAINAFISEVQMTGNVASNSVKFVVTSRPLLGRQYHLGQFQIENLEGNTVHDLQLVIERKIDGIARRTNCRPDMRTYLEEALYSKVDRTFLWVTLVLDILQKTPFQTQREFQRLVERLPEGLVAVYERFLYDIPHEYQEAASKLLHLIAEDSHRDVDSMEADSQSNIRETLETILGPFVRISGDLVSFVHQSAKEFLNELFYRSDHPLSKMYGVSVAVASELLAKCCISYLLLDDFDEDMFVEYRKGRYHSPTTLTSENSEDEDLNTFWDKQGLAEDNIFKDPDAVEWDRCKLVAEKNQLFDYAVLHWTSHFASCCTISSFNLQKSALKLSDSSNLVYSNWLRYYWHHCEPNLAFPTNFTPFITSCFFGHLTTVKILSNAQSLPGQNTASQGLYWSSLKGYTSVVSYLLSRQTAPNWKMADRQTPLIVATRFDHVEVIKLLLRANGIDVNDRGKEGRTALSMAAGNGYNSIVELLLQHEKIQPDLPDFNQWTLIFWAVGGKYVEIVRRFALDERTNLNHADKTGRSILSWAAGAGDREIIQFLILQDEIDLQQRDSSGRTALSWAAANGHIDVVSILRKSKGVNMSGKDDQGRNVISWAATGGHHNMVQYLIKYYPSGVDEADENGWTPLFWALFKDSPETVKTLLSSGMVDPNREDKNGRSALSWARGYGYTEVVELLVTAPRPGLES